MGKETHGIDRSRSRPLAYRTRSGALVFAYPHEKDPLFLSTGKKITKDMFEADSLLGKEVYYKGARGVIKKVSVLPAKIEWVKGKYLYDGRYALPKPLKFENSVVGVYWLSLTRDNEMLPFWVDVNALNYEI